MLARLRTIWPSWLRHCSTSSGGASQLARALPSLKYTASMVTVSPGAADGRSRRYDTPAAAEPAAPKATMAVRVRRENEGAVRRRGDMGAMCFSCDEAM
ncbi:hypothetical protein G6F57_021817 [Rhizopus arrhizus]|nr:hypothetical protein G6F57_021817 [Rhizopus arrhizus]